MEIRFQPKATRQLARLPANVVRLIRAKIDQLGKDPSSLANNIKALRGEAGMFRLRVGDWRVIYSEDGMVIDIIRIAPRGSAYD